MGHTHGWLLDGVNQQSNQNQGISTFGNYKIYTDNYGRRFDETGRQFGGPITNVPKLDYQGQGSGGYSYRAKDILASQPSAPPQQSYQPAQPAQRPQQLQDPQEQMPDAMASPSSDLYFNSLLPEQQRSYIASMRTQGLGGVSSDLGRYFLNLVARGQGRFDEDQSGLRPSESGALGRYNVPTSVGSQQFLRAMKSAVL
jgi:hypothetical protein